MIQKFIFIISASALLIACKADCPDKIEQEDSQYSLTLDSCSDALKELIQSKESHVRGFTLGDPISKLNEKDEDLAAKDGFNINFTPDISTDYWIDIEYFYNDSNIVTQFYFMLGKIYQFEAIQDFSNGYPFILTGIGIYANTDYSLNNVNDNFILDLSSNVFAKYDDSNCIIYSNDISNNPDNKLNLLLDGSGIGYFYGDITIGVYNNNDNDNWSWSGKNISIKSFSGEISQPDFFTYDDKCNYIVDNNITTSSNGHHECIKYVVEAKKLNNQEDPLQVISICNIYIPLKTIECKVY